MTEAIIEKVFKKYPNVLNALKGVGMHLLCAVLSFFASRGCITGNLIPFGMGFCAGVPPVYSAASAAGALLGYVIPTNGNGGFGYISVVFAICAIKLLTKELKGVCRSHVFCALIAFLMCAAIQLVIRGFEPYSIALALGEAVLSGFFAYIISVSAFTLSKSVSGVPLKKLSCILLSFNILFMFMYSINISQLNIGRIIICSVILCVAQFSGAGGGAVCSVAAGAAYLLAYPHAPLPFTVLCVAGLVGGLISSAGKVAAAISFAVAGSGTALIYGVNDASVAIVAELAFGAAIFIIFPDSLVLRVGKLLSPPTDTASFDGMRNALAIRLDFASKTLNDVSDAVDEVAAVLAKRNAPDFNKVIAQTERDACRGCLMRTRCWETLRGDTVDSVIELARFAREGEKPQLSKKTMEFGGRCTRMEAVMNALNRHYSDYLASVSAHSQAEQVRKTIAGQFGGMSRMLYDLSHEFSDRTRFDLKLASEISSAMFDLGLVVENCCCRIDPWERMNVEISAKADKDAVINRIKIGGMLKAICKRDFAVPLVIRSKEQLLITATENTVFTVDTGVTQFCCPDSTVCGDSYEMFFDGRGRLFIVLSDGMGHGNRAALDSSMASGMMTRLLKAGFGYDCSLDIVNSSMIYKSSEESLATIDIAAIDLFTGKTELLKAGAAPTLMRRSGRTGKAQSTSLPAGILQEVGFDKATVSLKAEDIVILMSDGATHSGTEWICAELEEWQGGTAQQLSEKIALAAKQRRDDGHSDDITVITSIIKKAV